MHKIQAIPAIALISFVAACGGGQGPMAVQGTVGDQFELGRGTYTIVTEEFDDGSVQRSVVVFGQVVPCDGTVDGCRAAVQAHLDAS